MSLPKLQFFKNFMIIKAWIMSAFLEIWLTKKISIYKKQFNKITQFW